ncbi:Bud site selection protein, Revert to axial protein 1 [Haplosporangium bisporale]|nr:Bud site selection protein, Revert to axial protein 1 [Haplosporangium bisporale]
MSTLGQTSSISNSTGSSQSRKPQLVAIQTQKAQASVTFRPVSSTSSGSYYDGSSHLRPTSGISDNDNGSLYPRPISTVSGMSGMSDIQEGGVGDMAQSQHQPQPGDEKPIDSLSAQYSQDLDALPPSATLSSFPFTPSTLVDSAPSPVESEQRYPQTQQQQQPQEAQQPRHDQHQGSQGMDMTYSTSSDDSRAHHLPNLWQVLNRKTLPPVCLFNFYLYMRDFEKSSEEVDFWLDVTAHEVLWRLFKKILRKLYSFKPRSSLIELSELLKKRHEQAASVTLDIYEPHWSAANRYLEMAGTRPSQENNQLADHTTTGPHLKDKSSDPVLLQLNSPRSPLSPSSTLGHPHQHLAGAIPPNWEAPLESPFSRLSRSQSSGGPSTYKPPEMSSTSANTIARAKSNAEGKSAAALKRMSMAGVSKEDLFRSAERIYYKYLIPQAEKRVRIPGSVRHRVAVFMDGKIKENMGQKDGVPTAASSTGNGSTSSLSQQSESAAGGTGGATLSTPTHNNIRRKNSNNKSTLSQLSSNEKGRDSSSTLFSQPDQDLGLVFAEAREIVFEGMESYYFPRFIRARAYGNMVHSQRLFRLVLGLFLMFVGFSVVLCLIFLNVQPRSVRAWALIPMFIGILLCTTFQFNICPILVLMQVSETKWMQFAKIKEPYIMMLHRRRGIKVVVVAILYTLCVGILFGLLPGHRL